MVPLAQSMLIDAYPKSEYNKAMGLFGLGVVLGPILGPFLGGVVDQYINWHWIFFINVPLGGLALLMAVLFATDTQKVTSSCDFIGLILMAVTICCLQLFLSQGNDKSWFQSHYILFLFCLTISCGMLFISYSFWIKNPIVNLRLFFNRNFASSSLFIFCYGTPLLGSMVLIPLFLGDTMGYTPIVIGKFLLLRGLGALIVIPFVANVFMRFVDTRIIIIIGAILAGIGNWMFSEFNMFIAPTHLYWPLLVQGAATGFIMPPLFSIAFSTLAPESTDEGSGLFNFCRSLGTSIGITITILILDITKQYAWSSVGEHINKFNPHLTPWLATQGLTLKSPAAGATLGNLLTEQSNLLGYVDSFRFIAILSFSLILLTFFLKTPKKLNNT